MGAEEFFVQARGATPELAFSQAHEQAAYDYGHAGYTGTIAEKPGFRLFGHAEGIDAAQLENAVQHVVDCSPCGDLLPGNLKGILTEEFVELYQHKWEAACCIELDRGDESEKELRLFAFMGWASS